MKNKEIDKLIKSYHNSGRRPIPFDFKEAYNSLLNGNNGNNINYHYVHFYPGRIYPYIPRYLFSLPEMQNINGILLDPFAGSGTILLEWLLFVGREAFGVEINPLGRLITKVKTTPFSTDAVSEYMKKLHKIYSDSVEVDDLIPPYDNIDLWFSKDAINKLARLKNAILNLEAETNIKDFFWLCFSNIIRKVSMADPYVPPPVVLKLEKYRGTSKFDKLKEHLERAKSPNVWEIFEKTVATNRKKVDDIFVLLKDSPNGEIIWDDARRIKKASLLERGVIDKNNSKPLPPNSVDIIFTSPPYLTAQKYIRTSKLELLWLGYSVEEINRLEKNCIGTERVKFSDVRIENLGYKSIDALLEKTYAKSRSRAITVYSYFKNMIDVIKELRRILKAGGYLILVVGEIKS